MPIQINATITDSNGLPINHIAEISEVVPDGTNNTVTANVWSDKTTGAFTFVALNPNSFIAIEAYGYEPVIFPVNDVPSVIKLQEAIVIEGKTTKKSNNTLLIAIGVISVGALAYYLSANSSDEDTKKKPKPKRFKYETAKKKTIIKKPKPKVLPPKTVYV